VTKYFSSKFICLIIVFIISPGIMVFSGCGSGSGTAAASPAGTSASASIESVITRVKGVAATGQTLDIYGTGFGTKTQPTPIRYDDFESGTTVGHLITDDLPWWSRQTSPGQVASIADDSCRPNKTKCGKFVESVDSSDTAVRSDAIYRRNVGFASTGKMYLNFWSYVDVLGNADGTSSSYQIKFIQTAKDWSPGNPITLPTYEFSHWQFASPPNSGWYNKTYQANYWDGGGSSTSVSFPQDAFKTPGWYHISVQTDFGTIGSANGSTKMWVSKPGLSGAYSLVSTSGVKYVVDSGYPDYIKFGWYAGSYYPTTTNTFTTTLYYDNIYIDNSFARVEIGDSNSYDSCTHREIQIPITWSSDHIQVKFNKGSFPDNQTVYLFVIDENGNPVGNGFPVKTGSAY
jgi:hypothetical protein